jgi:hypothetical protein
MAMVQIKLARIHLLSALGDGSRKNREIKQERVSTIVMVSKQL